AVPALLSCGVDRQTALGTSKLQSTFGSASAAWHYSQAKTVSLPDCMGGLCLALVGAALGTLVVQRVDPAFLKRFIPFLLAAVAIYALLKPQLGAEDAHPRMKREWFDLTFGLLFG